jgi:hypothetical protein
MRRRVIAILLCTLIATPLFAKKKASEEVHVYHSVVPLGILKFTSPDPRPMYVLVTAENPAFASWETTDHKRMPIRADGTAVKYFPSHIDFRITASARSSELVGIDEYPVQIPPGDLNDYMTKLRFRVAIFHGLEKRTIEPDGVENVGMPDDVSYDERVYRVGFDIGAKVPVEDRIVLEVLSPNGDRLGKFHLEF